MNKKILNIFIFIVYSILLTFFIDCISRSSFNEAFNFLTNSFNIFLYNVLIIVLTLSPCFLFKIRLFYFSLISLIWFILALANNLVTKFRGMPLTFYDIGMIENAGIGVAVANAVPEAREAADFITVDNDSNAIAAVISSLELGRIGFE